MIGSSNARSLLSGSYSSNFSWLGYKSGASRLGSITSAEEVGVDNDVPWYSVRDWFVSQVRSSEDESECDKVRVLFRVGGVTRGREFESSLAWRSRCPILLLSSMSELCLIDHLYFLLVVLIDPESAFASWHP